MNVRALTLAIRLLSTSLAAVGIVGLSGCWCGDPWGDAAAVELGTEADLFAVVSSVNYDGETIAVGADGTVVVWREIWTDVGTETVVERSTVGDADLRAIWAGESAWWVVGDGGMAAVSGDRGQTWTTVDLGTTANLRAITSTGSRLVIVGDEVVLVQAADGTWSAIPAPEGGWGRLRAVFTYGSHVYAVGLGGVIWSTQDPSGAWVAESSGVDADLFAVGHYWDWDNGKELVAVVGAGGTLLLGSAGGWTRAKTGTSVDLIGYEEGIVLGAGGQVYEIVERRRLERLETFAGARAISYGSYESVVVVGDGGMAREKPYYECVGGRPFTVDGEQLTASLCGELGAAQRLAAAWAQDGLHEHASVASFARFGLELLALGAPPQLLREVQVAVQDELRHARLCFELAQRFGGVAVAAGAMPLPAGALARAGDPVATALALFEEGCINESLAACEAADAAAACEDPQVREVLEIIAADERRHATLAWSALRWLLDTHGERVRGPLRARLARLGPGWMRDEHDFDPRLGAYGRLSPQRRAEVHRRVFAELIRPLAHALLDPSQVEVHA